MKNNQSNLYLSSLHTKGSSTFHSKDKCHACKNTASKCNFSEADYILCNSMFIHDDVWNINNNKIVFTRLYYTHLT